MEHKKILLATALGLTFSALTAKAATYNITDLGSFGTQSVAYGINNNGQIVGYSDTAAGQRAFLYSNGTMTDLGIPAGGYGSYAVDINDSSQVVGVAATADGYQRAFLYNNGAMTDVGAYSANYPRSVASAINSIGQIVGEVSPANGTTGHAFLNSNGTLTMIDQNSFPPFSTLSYSNALDINDSGQVVGAASVNAPNGISSFSFAFLYSNGVMTNLGTLPNSTSTYATGINNIGQIVGVADSVNGYAHAFLYSHGVMTDLGTLPNSQNTFANAINDSGQVVGDTRTINYSDGSAFLYGNGEFSDLNTLIAADSGWKLLQAMDINNQGQIVGSGVNRLGQIHAFLLTPSAVPVPDTFWLFSSALAVFGLLGRRKVI